MAFATLRRFFGRRIVLAVGLTLGLICVAVAINAIGIRIVGDVETWRDWLEHHRLHFFVWRLALYVLTAWGWWWMHKRIRAREPNPESRTRLRRAEIAAVCTIVLLETSMLFQQG